MGEQVDAYYEMTIDNLKDTLPQVVDHFMLHGCKKRINDGLRKFDRERPTMEEDFFSVDPDKEAYRQKKVESQKFLEESLEQMKALE